MGADDVGAHHLKSSGRRRRGFQSNGPAARDSFRITRLPVGAAGAWRRVSVGHAAMALHSGHSRRREPDLAEVVVAARMGLKIMHLPGSNRELRDPNGLHHHRVALQNGSTCSMSTLLLSGRSPLRPRIERHRILGCCSSSRSTGRRSGSQREGHRAERPVQPAGDPERRLVPDFPILGGGHELDVEPDTRGRELGAEELQQLLLPRPVRVAAIDRQLEPVGVAGLGQKPAGLPDFRHELRQREILGMNGAT